MFHITKAFVTAVILTFAICSPLLPARAQLDPNVYYSLICRTSGMALDNGWSYTQGTKETQWWWNASGTNQAWQITPAASPFYYNLTCKTSNMALDNRGSHTVGDYLIQWPLQNGNTNQEWEIIPAANAAGYYNLICKTSGMAMDNRGSHTAGDYVIQWPLQYGNTNQQWRISPMYSWAVITFQTGSDDLRGSVSAWIFGSADSWVNVTLTINGVTQTFYDVSHDQNWASGSFHTVYLPLNTPVSYVNSGDVDVTLAQWSNGTWNSDTWNLQGISVTLSSNPTYFAQNGQGLIEAQDTVLFMNSSQPRALTTSNPSVDYTF